jgi:hypothetical protein
MCTPGGGGGGRGSFPLRGGVAFIDGFSVYIYALRMLIWRHRGVAAGLGDMAYGCLHMPLAALACWQQMNLPAWRTRGRAVPWARASVTVGCDATVEMSRRVTG